MSSDYKIRTNQRRDSEIPRLVCCHEVELLTQQTRNSIVLIAARFQIPTLDS